MKPVHFDSTSPISGKPFRMDDVNIKFVDGIGMYLEPSDPGFVPYGTPQPNQKTKPVKHQVYYPSKEADQVVWLINFRNKILAYIAALGLDATQTAAIIADCRWLVYILSTWLPAVRAYAPSCTEAVKAAQSGDGSALCALPVFTAPALPPAEGTLPAVVPVLTGARDRIFAFVQEIKVSPGRTDAIEADLRTVGSVSSSPDPATLQPVITAKINGLHMDLIWNWGGNRDHVDLLQIQADRSDGKGFVDLVHDTTPGYTDTTPFPAASTVWKYRGIFQVDGSPIGLWSATVSVAVGG